MRSPAVTIALALGLVACGDGAAPGAAPATSRRVATGPEPLVVRIAATGGPARAYRWPALDAAIWASRAAVPAGATVVGFDPDAGTLLLLDRARRPWRLTLGAGALALAGEDSLEFVHQGEGSDVVATTGGTLARYAATDAQPWRARPNRPPLAVEPLRKGAFVHVEVAGTRTTLAAWLPPDSVPQRTLELDRRAHAAAAAGGDRLFVATGGEVASIATRDLTLRTTIAIDDTILALAPTPSGDRLFVLGRDGAEARVTVVDKYTDEVLARVAVPASAGALRMDPLGRSVLVRFGTDSALAISVADYGAGRPFASGWRDDLPLVFPDGRVGALRDGDVHLVGAADGRVGDVVAGGGGDVWAVVTWNGFRRGPNEASGAPAPIRRDTATLPVAATDSAPPLPEGAPDSVAPPGVGVPVTPATPRRASRDSAPPARPAPPAEPAGGAWIVQFAALRVEEPARQLAGGIRVNGERARVIESSSAGTTLYRVILGPYRTREEAEQVGAASGRDHFVFEGGRP